MAGLGIALVVGGPAGAAIGAAAAVVCYVVVGRLEPRAVRQRRERVTRDLPAAAGLLSAAVAAGATPVAAVEVVAVAIGGPLGEDLQNLAAVARLGGDISAGWQKTTNSPDAVRLARVMSRAVQTGAPLADALGRLAADLHAERRFEIDRRARSVGVRAAAPLGLCFLPGFILVGVVPVVVGLASAVLGPLL